MDSDLPPQWAALGAYERDMLIGLTTLGPMSGRDLRERVGGTEGRESEKVLYDRLGRLRERGLVEKCVGGRDTTWKPTDDGTALIEDVRAWVGGGDG